MRFKTSLFSVVALITGLMVVITPSARAETLVFPCGGTATYSVIMPAGIAQDGGKYGNPCSGELTLDSKVKIIGDLAFDSSHLTSVVIPNSVTTIGYRAFAFSKLSSVIIPNSVTSIGERAFDQSKLTSVEIPNSVKSIGVWAFFYTPLTSVTIPDSVTSIGDKAFAGTSLKTVTIPNSVKTIGEGAFAGSMIESVVLPNSLFSIKKDVFSGTNLKSIAIPSSVKEIGEGAFSYTKLDSISIPNSVISIGRNSFQGAGLTTIIISNSVTNIGAGAFSGNYITSIVIPSSVLTIGDGAFSNNSYLEFASIPETLVTLGKDVFSGRNSLKSIEYCGKLTGLSITPICTTKLNTSRLSSNPAIVKLTVHYQRAAADYSGWELWLWRNQINGTDSDVNKSGVKFTGEDAFGKFVTLDINEMNKFDDIGIIVRKGEWLLKDLDIDRFISKFSSDGKAEVWLRQGDPVIYYSNPAPVASNPVAEEPKAAISTKKITITCVKGKLAKKVTAVKPVCPKGYKKK
jgi:hypothetical protein